MSYKDSRNGGGAMEITVNTKLRTVDANTTTAGLLAALQVPREHTAVEVNGVLIEPGEMDRPLTAGDVVEVVRFVGGG